MEKKRCCCSWIPFRRSGAGSSPSANNNSSGAGSSPSANNNSTIESDPGAFQCQETPLSSIGVPKCDEDMIIESGPGASQCLETLLSSTNVPSKFEGDSTVESDPGASQYQETLLSSTIVPSKSEGDSTVAAANPRTPEAQASSSSSSIAQMVYDIANDVCMDGATLDEENVNAVLDGLMERIYELLELVKLGKSSPQPPATKQYWPSTSKLSELLSEEFSQPFKDSSEAAKAAVLNLLSDMGTAHLAIAGLLVVANSLEKFEEVSRNQTDCLRLLKAMARLLKLLVKGMNGRNIPLIKEATVLIVEGYMMYCSHINSSKFSSFFSPSINNEQLGKFIRQLDHMYERINAQMNESMTATNFRSYPKHAVGIEGAVKDVVDLLEWESENNALAIILVGLGGTGKTTIADAVFSVIDVQGCKYSRVTLGSRPPDIIELQTLIIKDLILDNCFLDIRTFEDGQRELGRILEKVPAFIYIDDVWDQDALRQLLPKDMNKAKKVRLMLTARDSNVQRACRMKTKVYHVNPLSEMESRHLLGKELRNETDDKNQMNTSQLDQLVQICGGVPTLLTMVAGFIRGEEDKEKAIGMLMDEHYNRNHHRSPYSFAIDNLPGILKDSLLDICSFFKGWKWNEVANIVGKSNLDSLENRALVSKSASGVVCVHDVILDLCRSSIELRHSLDPMKAQDLEGITEIWWSENKEPFHISATKLDSMSSSLRILSLGKNIKVEGNCNKKFQNLIFFEGAVPYLPFDVSMAKELRYLNYKPKKVILSQMPPGLQHLELDGELHTHAFKMKTKHLVQLGNLRILRLTNFAKLKKLHKDLGDLVKELQDLTLSYCESVEKLPRSISKLRFLRVLRMDYCSSLKHLPNDLGSLSSLQDLNLQGCMHLEALPDNFGSLSSLQELNLQGCRNIRALPRSFGKLLSLKLLDLSSCEGLLVLPVEFGELASLTELNLQQCERLEKLPKSFGELKYLVKLDLSYCYKLKELCIDDFSGLSSLQILIVKWCESLEKLPEDLHCLASLQHLDLSWCVSLKELPEDFHLLPSLQHLDLSSCGMLEAKWIDSVIKLKTLEMVLITDSPMLVQRWGEIQREGDQSWPFTVFTG